MAVETSMVPASGTMALSAAAARLVFKDRSGRPYDAVQMELLLALCAKHGLVPELKHLVLISDQVYVTNAGLLHVAHQHGDLDGIETRPATPEERAAYLGDDADTKTRVWRCDVWRRGQGRPYTGWGKAASTEPGAAKTHPQEMAATRSTNRALRLAFNIGLTSLEEVGDDAPPARAVDQQTGEIRQSPAPPRAMAPARQQPAAPTLAPAEPTLTPRQAANISGQVVKLATDQGFEEMDALRWLAFRVRALGKGNLEELTVSEGVAVHKAAASADFGPTPVPTPDDDGEEEI